MYTIERGLGAAFRPLAAAFALAGGLACFGIGNLAQSCEIAAASQELFRAGPLSVGLTLTILVAAILCGGLRRIGKLTGLLVPLMSGLYLLCVLPILLLHAAELPGIILLILRSAFGLRAAGGGAFGWTLRTALRQGFARGVFSNEAGLGSAPMAHAAASGTPGGQACWGVLEVLIDSFVICTLTALVVLLSGIWREPGTAFATPGAAAAEAFRRLLPFPGGSRLVALCLLFFAFSSILGWGWYGEICWGYLFRGRTALPIYRVVFALLCLPGALGSGALLWGLSDALNALMAIPNLISLLLLSGTAAKICAAHFDQADRKTPRP